MAKEIESGISYDNLLNFKFKLYYYKTQITLHGVFPKHLNTRLKGYKYITVNKNGSCGIRWPAVDLKLKQVLYSHLRNISTLNNSLTDNILIMSPRLILNSSTNAIEYESFNITSKSVYMATLDKMLRVKNRIDTFIKTKPSAILINCKIESYLTPFFGIRLLFTIEIRLLPPQLVNSFMTAVMNRPYSEYIGMGSVKLTELQNQAKVTINAVKDKKLQAISTRTLPGDYSIDVIILDREFGAWEGKARQFKNGFAILLANDKEKTFDFHTSVFIYPKE